MIRALIPLVCQRCGGSTPLIAEGNSLVDQPPGTPEGMTYSRVYLTPASNVALSLFTAAHQGPFVLGGS